MPDLRLIKELAKVTGEKNIDNLFKKVSDLEHQMGRPLDIGDTGLVTSQLSQAGAAMEQASRKATVALEQIARINTPTYSRWITPEPASRLPYEQQMRARVGQALPSFYTDDPASIARLRAHSPDYGSAMQRIVREQGSQMRAIEDNIFRISRMQNVGASKAAELAWSNVALRQGIAPDSAMFNKLRLRAPPVGGDTRLMQMIMGDVGRSVMPLRPMDIAAGTASTLSLSSGQPIVGRGVTLYDPAKQYNLTGEHQQRVSQAIQTMARAGLMNKIYRVGDTPPIFNLLPINTQIAMAQSISGVRPPYLTGLGREAYSGMGFNQYPGWGLKDPLSVLPAFRNPYSWQQQQVTWAPRRIADNPRMPTINWGGNIFPVPGSLGTAASNFYYDFHNKYRGVFHPGMEDTLFNQTQQAMFGKGTGAYGSGENIGFTKWMNFKGSYEGLIRNPWMAGEQMVSGMMPMRERYGPAGQGRYLGDIYDFITGQHAATSAGSRGAARQYAGAAGLAIRMGAGGAYSPEQVLRLGGKLSSFSQRALTPRGGITSMDDRIALMSSLGGMGSIEGVQVAIERAFDQVAAITDEYDNAQVQMETLRATLSPEERSRRGESIRRGRIGRLTGDERVIAEEEERIRGNRAKYGSSKARISPISMMGGWGAGGGGFPKIPSEEKIGHMPEPHHRYVGWMHPWLRRGIGNEQEFIKGTGGGTEDLLSTPEMREMVEREQEKRETWIGKGDLPAPSTADIWDAISGTGEGRGHAPGPLGTEEGISARRSMGRKIKGPSLMKRTIEGLSKLGLAKMLPLIAGGALAIGLHALFPGIGGIAGMGLMMGMTQIKPGDDWDPNGVANALSALESQLGRPATKDERDALYASLQGTTTTQSGKTVNAQAAPSVVGVSGNIDDAKARKLAAAQAIRNRKRQAGDFLLLPGGTHGEVKGRMVFQPGQMKEAQAFVNAISTIKGLSVKALTGAATEEGRTAAELGAEWKGIYPKGEASGILEAVEGVVGTLGAEASKDALMYTESIRQGKTPEESFKLTLGRQAGRINMFQVKGSIIGASDIIANLAESFKGLGQDVKVTTEEVTEFGKDTAPVTKTMMELKGHVLTADEGFNDMFKSLIPTNEGLEGSASSIGMLNEKLDDSEPLWQTFIDYGSQLRTLSWSLVGLQMSFLGVFFSMRSIMNMLQQGIQTIFGPLQNVEQLMEAYALAQADMGETGFDASKYLDKLGLTVDDLTLGWKRAITVGADLTTIFAGLGTAVLLDPKAWDSIKSTIDALAKWTSDPKNIAAVTNVVAGISDAIRGMLPLVTKVLELLDALQKFKLPKELSFLFGEGQGGQGPSGLQALGVTTVGASFAMALAALPILIIQAIGTALSGPGWLGKMIWGGGIGTAAPAAGTPAAVASAGATAEVAGGGVFGAIAAHPILTFLALEETTRDLMNTNQMQIDIFKQSNVGKTDQGKMLGTMMDVTQYVSTLPSRMMSGNIFGPTILDRINDLTGKTTLWDLILGKEQMPETKQIPTAGTQMATGGGILNNITYIVYGDLLYDAADKMNKNQDKVTREGLYGATGGPI
jgi:hypothetical protein